MSEDSEALARRSWEIVSQRNPHALEEAYAADSVLHEPDQDLQGLEEVKQYLSMYVSAFPDLNATVEDVIAEGDKVVTRWALRGTHKGEIEEFGPPTGRQIELEGISIHGIEAARRRHVETREVDGARAEAFAGQMFGTLNDAMIALMTSIGHQTKLFDVMADLPPSTSEEIASAANLDERYVREWLGAMVVGGVVDYDPDAKTYRLPPEHAAYLTRAAGPDNLAGLAQFVPLLGNVEGGIVESFRNGGGVPYSAYTRFQEVVAEDSAQVYGATLIRTTLPLVPSLVERLESGIAVADIGCGQGVALNLMAQAFPNSRFVGYDLSEEGVAAASLAAERIGLENARFEVRDVTTLDERERYQLITAFDVIPDLAHPAEVLRNIFNALGPGGTFLMVDMAASSLLHENVEHPLGPFLYAVSTMHCMTVSLEQGGVGLGTVWGEQKARQMLADAGFREVEVEQVEGDILNNYYIARKG